MARALGEGEESVGPLRALSRGPLGGLPGGLARLPHDYREWRPGPKAQESAPQPGIPFDRPALHVLCRPRAAEKARAEEVAGSPCWLCGAFPSRCEPCLGSETQRPGPDPL